MMGDRSLRILCYADDAIIVAENEDDLQRLLNKFKTTAERFNMFISLKKTQVMLMINNHIIEQVMDFNYLGVETSSDRYLANEARTQANKAARIANYLRDIIWRTTIYEHEE
ncbi:hypothetical protein ACFW04_011244 [Cataglyphis niger]